MRAAAVLLLALLLVPVALADHAFSHRVYVVGRVIDAEGAPAAGVPLQIHFENMSAEGGCFERTPAMTNARGDFVLCRHTHRIPANGTVTVRAGNASRTVGVDPDLRHASVHLQLDAVATRDVNGERLFARRFDVVGRAFTLLPQPRQEEGVLVNATPIFGNVSVELRVGERVLANATASTGEHGLYAAELEVEEVPAGAYVRARIGSVLAEEPASALFRRADVDLVRDLRLAAGPGEDAPGSASTPAGAWGALAALAVAALALARRR